jgi:hypothetical protein
METETQQARAQSEAEVIRDAKTCRDMEAEAAREKDGIWSAELGTQTAKDDPLWLGQRRSRRWH